MLARDLLILEASEQKLTYRLGHIGMRDDIGKVTVFLAFDECSHVDGCELVRRRRSHPTLT